MTFTAKRVSSEDCFHLLLIAISPLQKIFDHPGLTHEVCNLQALAIMRSDGLSTYADVLQPYLTELNMGVYWADKDWKNVHHYFDPVSGRGLWQFTHAIDNFQMYYQAALKAARQNHLKKAMFFLGAAAHLVQDLCVPHHARGKLLNGHKHYESWVQERCGQYLTPSKGIYQEGKPVTSLLLNNAGIAADLFDWVKHDGDDTLYNKATDLLLPQAQKTTAGLFLHFANQIAHSGLSQPAVTVA